MKFHPDVLAAHAEFGGDLEDMQRRYAALPAPDDGLEVVAWAQGAALDELTKHKDATATIASGLLPSPFGSPVALVRLSAAQAALQSKDEQIERLELSRGAASKVALDAIAEKGRAEARAEDAEQQVQKLTAENERLREALRPFAEASETYDEFWATETDGQAHQDEEDAEMITFFSLGREINMVPLSAFRLARTTLQKEQADG